MHVITGTAVGGAEVMLYRYLRALGEGRRSHMVASMMPSGPMAIKLRELGVRVEDLGVTSARALPWGVFRLRRLIDQTGPAVLHGWMYHGSLIATLALLAGRRGDIGLLWAIHHSLVDPQNEKPMTRMVLRSLRRLAARADLITYCAQISAQQHQRYGFPADREQIIHNAIDTAEFTPDPQAHDRLCAVAGIPPGRLLIGNIGRAHPMKDHVAFGQVIAQLAARGLDVHGVVIGAGQPNGPAIQAARAAGAGDRISALDVRDDIAALVPGLDLYLLSSAWGESFSLAVGEAMAAGVPAIVTDLGDCGWLVGDCGRVCPPRRIDLMTGAAVDILTMPQDARDVLSRACRNRIEQNLSLSSYLDAHALAYRTVARRGETSLTRQAV